MHAVGALFASPPLAGDQEEGFSDLSSERRASVQVLSGLEGSAS